MDVPRAWPLVEKLSVWVNSDIHDTLEKCRSEVCFVINCRHLLHVKPHASSLPLFPMGTSQLRVLQLLLHSLYMIGYITHSNAFFILSLSLSYYI